MASNAESVSNDRSDSLPARYESVRSLTVGLTSTLMAEDTVIQSMPDVSPTKWHLAHVTWFFERFILEAHVPGYQVFDERFDFILNSYF